MPCAAKNAASASAKPPSTTVAAQDSIRLSGRPKSSTENPSLSCAPSFFAQRARVRHIGKHRLALGAGIADFKAGAAVRLVSAEGVEVGDHRVRLVDQRTVPAKMSGAPTASLSNGYRPDHAASGAQHFHFCAALLGVRREYVKPCQINLFIFSSFPLSNAQYVPHPVGRTHSKQHRKHDAPPRAQPPYAFLESAAGADTG